jgi:hypothetical protein
LILVSSSATWPSFYQSCLTTQPQHLHKQPTQCLTVTLAKLTDGTEIRALPSPRQSSGAPRSREESDATSTRLGRTRRATVPHHPRVILRIPALLIVARQDPAQIQSAAYRIAPHASPVSRRCAHAQGDGCCRRLSEILRRQQQQPDLVRFPIAKCLAHPTSSSRCGLSPRLLLRRAARPAPGGMPEAARPDYVEARAALPTSG